MDKFCLVLGESEILPGAMWAEYVVDVGETEMVCTAKKDADIVARIAYADFEKAEFGIGNGNLWLQCVVGGKILTFCSPRKCWKSEQAKLLISKINEQTEIRDMKAYKSYTGPFFFLAMFK